MRGDYVTALREFRPLAERGVAAAQYYLGNLYRIGRVVPHDLAEAVKLYRKAAEQGYVSALETLGNLYEYGHGVPHSYVEAYKWYSLAASQGEKGAAHIRNRLAKNRMPPRRRIEGTAARP
jgi:TPR repeat protein